MIPGNIPIGCLPVYLAMYGTEDSAHDNNHCLRRLNLLANNYNKHLKTEIKKLSNENPNIKIVYGDLYNAFEWLLFRAPYLGLHIQMIFELQLFSY